MARRSSGSMRWLPLGTAAFLLIVAVVVRTAASSGSSAADWSGTLVDPPRQRPVFTLQTIDGEPFAFAARTNNRLTFLFFGYTNCPDVCPTQMSALTGALRERPDLAGDVVFVTTDPIRDTPDRLRDWLSSFGYPVTALTGTSDELLSAQEAAGLAPAVAGPTRPDGSYEVGHAAQVLLITPDNQIHLVYPFGIRREDWIADLARIPKAWHTPADSGAPVPAGAGGDG